MSLEIEVHETRRPMLFVEKTERGRTLHADMDTLDHIAALIHDVKVHETIRPHEIEPSEEQQT